ncbi:MAG TPA: DUF3592 domain-containing protein [Pyrinomonadaceae bacterium]|jgi:hypothetical protein|nr:DUF3592 domain-containing protein [Pyrinomonadaceae bacterium]
MGLLDLFKRKKVDTEAARRAALLRTGRVGEGVILDVTITDAGDITHVFYNYNVNGVEYESSQTLDEPQRQHQGDYYPGARITVRYDPHRPANSVVV